MSATAKKLEEVKAPTTLEKLERLIENGLPLRSTRLHTAALLAGTNISQSATLDQNNLKGAKMYATAAGVIVVVRGKYFQLPDANRIVAEIDIT